MSEVDLSGCHLRQTNLRGSNLRNANLSSSDLCRADLSGANLTGANLKLAYVRGADLKQTRLFQANLESADLCNAFLLNTDLREANLFSANVKGASFNGAYLKGAILEDLTWDFSTRWFGCGGLHEVISPPEELEQDADFLDAKQISFFLDELQQGSKSKLHFEEYRKVADRVLARRGLAVYAFLLNKYAWYTCIYNHIAPGNDSTNRKSFEFVKLALQAKPKSGNYMDTMGIIRAIQYSSLDYHLVDDHHGQNLYRSSIEIFEDALDSDDFKKLSVPTRETIINRRKAWIEELKRDQNPFTEEMLSILAQDER